MSETLAVRVRAERGEEEATRVEGEDSGEEERTVVEAITRGSPRNRQMESGSPLLMRCCLSIFSVEGPKSMVKNLEETDNPGNLV